MRNDLEDMHEVALSLMLQSSTIYGMSKAMYDAGQELEKCCQPPYTGDIQRINVLLEILEQYIKEFSKVSDHITKLIGEG